MPGPVPKRSEHRRRRNKPESGPEVISIAPAGPEVAAPEPSEDWHPYVRDWYLSLQDSGQAAYYEASDWQMARIAAQFLSDEMTSGRPVRATMVAEWSSLAGSLLCTEGDRRRMRLELQRGGKADKNKDEVASVITAYQDMFGA